MSECRSAIDNVVWTASTARSVSPVSQRRAIDAGLHCRPVTAPHRGIIPRIISQRRGSVGSAMPPADELSPRWQTDSSLAGLVPRIWRNQKGAARGREAAGYLGFGIMAVGIGRGKQVGDAPRDTMADHCRVLCRTTSLSKELDHRCSDIAPRSDIWCRTDSAFDGGGGRQSYSSSADVADAGMFKGLLAFTYVQPPPRWPALSAIRIRADLT